VREVGGPIRSDLLSRLESLETLAEQKKEERQNKLDRVLKLEMDLNEMIARTSALNQEKVWCHLIRLSIDCLF